MPQIDLDLLIATVLAFTLGLTRTGWRGKLVLCVLLAAIAWIMRAEVIFHIDVSVAEDYFNGLNISAAASELAVVIAWTALWCALGTALAWTVRRRRSRPAGQ